MTDVAALKALRDRVLAHSGIPDEEVAGQPLRELDCYIWALVEDSAEEWKIEEVPSPTGASSTYLQATAPPLNGAMRFRNFGQYQEHKGERVFLCAKDRSYILPYTSSIDAAISLVEKKLPGWHWHIGHNDGPPPFGNHFRANVYPTSQHGPPPYAIAPTPALALIAALLAALEERKP